ncbi:MAG: hypothetical protein WBC06_07270 [Chitinophagaceae bacterium]
MALPRKLTAAEKLIFSNDFPLLDVDLTIVTDEPTVAYNCISWTVGVTNFWHWPGSLLTNFDSFYGQFNLIRKTKGHVAAWGHSDSQMTHGCISGPTHGPCWESKCGSLARIQDCLNELNGPAYGHVIAYYGYKRILKPFIPKYLLKYMDIKRDFSKEEIGKLNQLLKGIPLEVAADFEIKFRAWKNTWFKGKMASISDPYKRIETPEFKELKSMGKSIVPLLAKKLMDDSNFLALPAFEKIVATKKLVIIIDASDERILEGEQGRAYRTVKNYLASFK